MKRAAKALIRDGQGRILVLYRSETHPHLAHDIDLPGGEIDHLERLEQGLSRELVEETGLELKFRKEHRKYTWRPARIARRYHLYESVLTNAQPVTISWEHESYEWMDEKDFMEHPAIDGFIHRVQSWLKNSTSSAEA